MSDIEYPKLRYVEAFPVETNNGPLYGLRDPSGIAAETLIVSPEILYLLQYFDGSHSQLDIRVRYQKAFGDFLHENQLTQILTDLDKHLFLHNQNFERQLKAIEDEFRGASIRSAVHAGRSYAADPVELKRQIDGFFSDPRGAGRPDRRRRKTNITGLIAPHIDIRAGGPCYSHAYRALAESSGADCFVILGTGHAGLSHLYSTLAKDFETPFGTAACDFEFIDQLKSNYNGNIETDVLAHKNEHVIEFQLAFLKYLYPDRDFTFVPLLCSFSYHMLNGAQFPRESKIVAEFTEALRRTISSFKKKVCLIASVDFSHVGQRYGDQLIPDDTFSAKVQQTDHDLLTSIQNLDPDGFYRCIAQHQDRTRVCGFSSIYTLLETIDAQQCALLDYSSTEVDADGSTVTFASMSFS